MEAGHDSEGFGVVTSETSYMEYMRQPTTHGTIAEIVTASAIMNWRIVVMAEASDLHYSH